MAKVSGGAEGARSAAISGCLSQNAKGVRGCWNKPFSESDREVEFMKVTCSNCKATLECDSSLSGQLVTCPECQTEIKANPQVVVVKEALPHQSPATPDEAPETFVSEGRPSLLFYSPAIIIGVLIIAFTLPALNQDVPELFLPIIVGFAFLLYAFYKKFSIYYHLTTKNLSLYVGFIAKSEIQVRVRDIRAIFVKRNLLNVLLGTGTLVVGSSATSGPEITIPHIYKVSYIKDVLNELRDKETGDT